MTPSVSERALVLAPTGRDADIAAAMLGEASIVARSVIGVADLVRELRVGAGFAVITEEALLRADLRGVAEFLADQEDWSDFPFILLTMRGGGLERNPAAQRFLTTLGNVTFLERPFHPTTIVSLGQAALRARRRQYEARARLESLRAAQRELRETNAQLEARVEQRTRAHAAAMAQLHEAQKMETIGQLTGGVAHDFNNLLTPIVGGLDMLKRLHDDDRSQRIITGATQAADRATTLVARLLAFARRQNLEARPVDPTALVHGVLDLIRRSLGPQISVVTDTAQGLPAALVDPNQLELALLNLAVNARDAMPGGGELRIETALIEASADDADLPPGSFIRFAVADTGIGMDAETLKRAVEPFYSTKGVGKGTGLGLSMVHGLAGQSGGAMRIVSTPGVGTRIELFLPVSDVAAAPIEPDGNDAPETQRPLRILLVDDEEMVRRGTADMLATMGHDVDQAASPAIALAMLRASDYDLLVSDYLMPETNGIELIRAAERLRPAVRAVLITGFADVPEGMSVGIVRLAKPFRQAQLAHLVARAGAAGETTRV